jgi:Ni,Fe-hydrogenase I cytochrome b subunit
MQEASFNGFFRTIVYMVGFYYVFKFLARIFLPILMNKAVNKVQQNFEQQQAQYQKNNDSVDYQIPKNENPKSSKQIGDYIDYEEVE